MKGLTSARAIRRARWTVIALYIAASLGIAVQRGIIDTHHSTFKIFRQSFWHLVEGRNLYARYPAEQGTAPEDVFKYSPTAPLFFAPFAAAPYALSLFAWSLLGSLLLFRSLTLLLEPRQAVLAGLLIYPDLVASLQACSSNAQVAVLMILAYVTIERRQQLAGAAAIVCGTAIKIFPLAALTLALLQPRRRRFALIVTALALIALLLPLVVTPAPLLVQQYRWWSAVERSDAVDLTFGFSVMRLLRSWFGGDWPNWPLQFAGTIALLLPIGLRRDRWRDEEFRIGMLASLLVFCVLFNHQAERSSFVIASVGVAVWLTSPPRGTTLFWPRVLFALSTLVGLRTVPLLATWVVMQCELYGWRFMQRPTTDIQATDRDVGQPRRVVSTVAATESGPEVTPWAAARGTGL